MSGSLVSVIIPCFNNEDAIGITVNEVNEAVRSSSLSNVALEFILVDDGSIDQTWNRITTFKAENDLQLRAIKLRRNFGAYQAILAGFELAEGDIVMVMAADGDDPSGLVPYLIATWLEGWSLVQANRTNAGARSVQQWFGSLFYSSLRTLGARNVPEGGSDFMLVSREVLLLAKAQGWRKGNTLIQLYQHAPDAITVPYVKGRSRRSGWTFFKRCELFVQTLLDFMFKLERRPSGVFYEIEQTL